MTKMVKVSVPNADTKIDVDFDAFPQNVRDRLVEIGLTAHIRSAVNSSFSNELEKAIRENDGPAREAFEAAEKAKKEENAKYKIKSYKADEKAVKAFKESFEHTLDAVEVAKARIAEMLDGKIRAARGESGTNKALSSLVKANILAVLKSKGKKHRDAVAMVGDDPFAFIEKTARKRAGDDQDAYSTELAKLNAQYVEPARAMLADEPEDEDGTDDSETTANDADDLV